MFKDTIPKPNQIKIIISFVIVAVIITAIVVFRKDIFKVSENLTDAEKFYKEYNVVAVDNVYKYASIKDVGELIKKDKAVIFFGYKECLWCGRYAKLLNEASKENGIEEVYYVDIYNARKNKTKDYLNLLKVLDKYLSKDENENKRLYVPDVYVVKAGKIVGHNNETSMMESTDIDEYYKLNEAKLKESLNKLLANVKQNTCSDSKKGC